MFTILVSSGSLRRLRLCFFGLKTFSSTAAKSKTLLQDFLLPEAGVTDADEQSELALESDERLELDREREGSVCGVIVAPSTGCLVTDGVIVAVATGRLTISCAICGIREELWLATPESSLITACVMAETSCGSMANKEVRRNASLTNNGATRQPDNAPRGALEMRHEVTIMVHEVTIMGHEVTIMRHEVTIMRHAATKRKVGAT